MKKAANTRWASSLSTTVSCSIALVCAAMTFGAEVGSTDALPTGKTFKSRQTGVSPNAPSRAQNNPLHIAAGRSAAAVQLLIENGADLEKTDENQRTPLHCATIAGNTAAALALIEGGARLDSTDKCRATPLHLAIANKRPATAKLLLKHGADVDAVDSEQLTPLHYAASAGNGELANILLQNHASLKAKTKNGENPLHLAVKVSKSRVTNQATAAEAARSHTEVVKLLLKFGASKTATTSMGERPYDIARTSGTKEIAALVTCPEDSPTVEKNDHPPVRNEPASSLTNRS